MKGSLIAFLRENRSHIIESWLAETDFVGSVDETQGYGAIPYAVIEGLYDDLVALLSGRVSWRVPPNLASYRGYTFACHGEFRACAALRRSARVAFVQSIQELSVDDEGLDEADCAAIAGDVQEALDKLIGMQATICALRSPDETCPMKPADSGDDFTTVRLAVLQKMTETS